MNDETQARPPVLGRVTRALYVGCWQQVGHYTWLPGMRRVHYGDDENSGPWGYNGLDCDAFSTRGWHLEKKDGWTAIGLEDRTVDRRPASHSVFAADANLTFDEMFDVAEARFAEVVERLRGAGLWPKDRTPQPSSSDDSGAPLNPSP